MTQTTNIGLKKIDGSENWRQIFDYHNDSADKTDSAVAAVQDGLAIVANGNTHAAIASGQFVYVRNHSTLAEGLYKATAAIATNGTLSTSNLAADGSGGLNNLQAQVTSLNSKIFTIETTLGPVKTYWVNPAASLTIPLIDTSWQQGLIIGNTNGGGNFLNEIHFTSDLVGMTSLIGEDDTKIEARIDGKNVIITPKGSTTLRCVTLIGVF